MLTKQDFQAILVLIERAPLKGAESTGVAGLIQKINLILSAPTPTPAPTQKPEEKVLPQKDIKPVQSVIYE